MRYSQSTELALDSLFYMAAHEEKRDFSSEEIARAQSVSPSYLAKIFQQLAKAGILKSHRGARGGYSLGRATNAITLLDIASVFEGASPLYDCNAVSKNCSLGPKCMIVNTFNEAERAMHDVLRGVTLADLMESLVKNSSQAAWVGLEKS